MNAHTLSYRLGLDLGSNSIGWFMIWLNEADEPYSLGPGGVRVFPDGRDPQSKGSNAEARRTARGMRRRRDRYLKRRDRLMECLVHYGLMPEDELDRKALAALDPYKLRAKGLDRALPLHRVGRAFFHLNQRRGFRSNRRTDGGENDAGVIKEAVSLLKEEIESTGAQTLGEFLWRRHRDRVGVRARNTGTATKASYDFYPSRDLLEQEFDKLWEAQARYHPRQMTEEARRDIRDAIFHQRPLRPQPVGKCSLDPAGDPNDEEGFRLARAHPLAQRFRILQEVNNLEYGEAGYGTKRLDDARRERLVLEITRRNKLSFDRIRELLDLSEGSRFNLESDKRKELKGDETAAKLSHRNLFGRRWRAMPLDRQAAVAERLLNEQDDETMVGWLVDETGVDAETARRISDTLLPEGHARLGLRAIRRLIPIMERGLRYDEAATRVYGGHSKKRSGDVVARLPYYGEWMRDAVVGTGNITDRKEQRWGRLPNPTVHIGLGQLRRVLNAIVKEFGPPRETVVEMARDFRLSPARIRELEKEQTHNQERNEKRREDVKKYGSAPNARNVLKMRLWEELDPDPLNRLCPFTGKRISIRRLLSEEVETEHLIPFSYSWDDSPTNKIVSMRFSNRAKGRRTPHQAFGGSPTIDGFSYDWESIAQRAKNLPHNKRWRFEPDAMERFESRGGFLARQLNETGWFSRLAKDYIEGLTGPGKVWAVPGRLTEMIRAKWGLNSLLPDHNFTDRKNRADHRHHAIDALVAGLTDRSLLQKMASAYDDERDRIRVPEPWGDLRRDLKVALDRMIVSHRTDHAVTGKLHEATAHGLVRNPEKKKFNLVYRKELIKLKMREIDHIRDIRLRAMVKSYVKDRVKGRWEWKTAKGKEFEKVLSEALANFSRDHAGDTHIKNGLRHVRILKTEKPDYLVEVADVEGHPYKAYSAGKNAYIDIYETPDGEWHGEATTVFQANKSEHSPKWRRIEECCFIMRVYKGDLLALDHDGARMIMVIRHLDAAAGRFKLAAHNEAGNLDQRHKEKSDPFRWLMASYSTLKAKGAKRVRVDERGRVWRIYPKEGLRSL